MSVWFGAVFRFFVSHAAHLFFLFSFPNVLNEARMSDPSQEKGDDSVWLNPTYSWGGNSHHTVCGASRWLITLQDRFCSWGKLQTTESWKTPSPVSVCSQRWRQKKEPPRGGRWWPTGVNSSPQLMASKQTGAWDLQLQGTEFCQRAKRAGNGFFPNTSKKEYSLLRLWFLSSLGGAIYQISDLQNHYFFVFYTMKFVIICYDINTRLMQISKNIQQIEMTVSLVGRRPLCPQSWALLCSQIPISKSRNLYIYHRLWNAPLLYK